jgi:glutamate dehydrogenase (NADP+)
MVAIHKTCVKYGTEPDGFINYVKGANIGCFVNLPKLCSPRDLYSI